MKRLLIFSLLFLSGIPSLVYPASAEEPLAKRVKMEQEPQEKEDELQCPICLDFKECAFVSCFSCKQAFHNDCLERWKQINPSCPHCRGNLDEGLNRVTTDDTSGWHFSSDESVLKVENMQDLLDLNGFPAPDRVKIIYLDNNYITIINPEVFKRFPFLREIYFGFNLIERLDGDLFLPDNFIDTLSLENCNINYISPDFFDLLSQRLAYLDLSSNLIQQFPVGLFAQFTNLKVLDLRNLPLIDGEGERIVAEVRQNNPDCRIYFSDDDVPNVLLGQQLFPTPFFSILEFNDRGIQDLRDFFVPYPLEVRELHLGANAIQQVPPNIFDPFSNLEILDLSGNNYQMIPPGLFNNLICLRKLFLNNNLDPEEQERIRAEVAAIQRPDGVQCQVEFISDEVDGDLQSNGAANSFDEDEDGYFADEEGE